MSRFKHIFAPIPEKPAALTGIQAIKAWKPSTPAGRKCKATMLKWASLPPVRGAYDYRYGRLCPDNDPRAIANWYNNRMEASDVR